MVHGCRVASFKGAESGSPGIGHRSRHVRAQRGTLSAPTRFHSVHRPLVPLCHLRHAYIIFPQRRYLQFVSDPALPLRSRASRDGLVPGNRRGHARYRKALVCHDAQKWAVLVWCPEQSARGAEPGDLGAGGQCCLCTAAGSPLTATTVGQGVVTSTRQALSTVSSSDITAMPVSGQQHGLVVLDSAGQVR
jgi:hypothetical protein